MTMTMTMIMMMSIANIVTMRLTLNSFALNLGASKLAW